MLTNLLGQPLKALVSPFLGQFKINFKLYILIYHNHNYNTRMSCIEKENKFNSILSCCCGVFLSVMINSFQ